MNPQKIRLPKPTPTAHLLNRKYVLALGAACSDFIAFNSSLDDDPSVSDYYGLLGKLNECIRNASMTIEYCMTVLVDSSEGNDLSEANGAPESESDRSE